MNKLQKLMKDLYLQKDQQRGLEKTLLWLVSEIGEVSDLVAKNGNYKHDENIKQELKLEIADCQAWLYSVANLLEIDVEQAFFEKYPHKCPRCGNNPCICIENS